MPSTALPDAIGTLLSSWPLWRTLKFKTNEITLVKQTHSYGLSLGVGLDALELHCTGCKKPQLWEPSVDFLGLSTGLHSVSYVCRNCKEHSYTYYLWSSLNNDFLMVQKIGQHPKPLVVIPSIVENALGGDDAKFYRQGILCRNNNMGIAAVAYLRRVVENRTNAIIDLLLETEEGQEHAESLKLRLAERNFSRKIEGLNSFLPRSCRPGGHNPISILHSITSAGVHGESDEECVETFDEVRRTFELLIEALSNVASFEKKFASEVGNLARKSESKD